MRWIWRVSYNNQFKIELKHLFYLLISNLWISFWFSFKLTLKIVWAFTLRWQLIITLESYCKFLWGFDYFWMIGFYFIYHSFILAVTEKSCFYFYIVNLAFFCTCILYFLILKVCFGFYNFNRCSLFPQICFKLVVYQ